MKATFISKAPWFYLFSKSLFLRFSVQLRGLLEVSIRFPKKKKCPHRVAHFQFDFSDFFMHFSS